MKAKLEKAKEAAWATKATADASKQKFYDLEVQETEARLTEELIEVCRDYCSEVWIKVLNLAGVPAASEWRRAENVYYPPNSEKLLQHFWALEHMWPLHQWPLSNFQAPKPHLPLLRPPKGLARLVTKARGWKWPRAKKLKLCQRLRA